MKEIAPQEMPGGYMTPLAETALIASHYVVKPEEESRLLRDEERAASVYVAEGAGRIIIADHTELQRTTLPSVPVTAGDVVMIPAGLYYAFVNEGRQPLKLSEQRISFEVAFQ